MRYLFKRLDQQTTTTAHPQWAMGTHRSALSLQLGRVVADLDTPFSFKFPLTRETSRQLCLRAAQQQTGASPVTAVTIGSGSAALVG